MAEKPFLINSVIGNGRMLATLGKNSELYRIFWPHIDNYQHLQASFAGINTGHGTWWFVDCGKWHCSQSYVQDTNIVKTVLANDDTQLQVTITDFIEPDSDVLIRHHEIYNRSSNPVPLKFLYFAAFNIQNQTTENGVFYSHVYDAVVHYRHGYHFAVGADRVSNGYQCANGALEDGNDGHLHGSLVNLSPEGCQVWDMGTLQGQDKLEITIYICPGFSLGEAGQRLRKAEEQGYEPSLAKTTQFWADYLARGRQLSTEDAAILNLYKRSLLACALLCDRENGGIIAAPEFDEKYLKSGGYGYCWPRDCVFVADAMARAGYRDIAERFYRWSKKTQLPDGQWFQRYDTEGNLAPGWGIQIDQTGAVLWGIWQFYVLYGDMEFLKDMWSVVLKGAVYLSSFIDDETGLPLPTFDLWEERVGEHAYSSAAVYGGLVGAAEIGRALGMYAEAENWAKAAEGIVAGIEKYLWDPQKNAFFRTVKKVVDRGEFDHRKHNGERVYSSQRDKGYEIFQIWKDDLVDASLLGLMYPFEVVAADDERAVSTVELIEKALTCPRTGGIKRYEHDHYIGGNPWINTTLWLAIYRARAGRFEGALSLIRWAVNHRTEIGLLPEQVDQHSGNPAWVVPLTWSHAIFILAVLEMADRGQI